MAKIHDELEAAKQKQIEVIHDDNATQVTALSQKLMRYNLVRQCH